MRPICSVVLCAGLAMTLGCGEDEPEEPQVDPCLEFFDISNPTGDWMFARGTSAAPQPDPHYRVRFFRQGEAVKAYYVHDLDRYEMTGTRRELDWLFETGALTPRPGDPAPKVKAHAYLSIDDVCHVEWTDGFTVLSDGKEVEKLDPMGPKTLAPVGEATVFSYRPCTDHVVAGKGGASAVAAAAMVEEGEVPTLEGERATLTAWTDAAAAGGDCTLSFDYYWDGQLKEAGLGGPRTVKDHHKWTHTIDLNFVGSHDVTFEHKKACGGGEPEVYAVSCGLFNIM